MSGEQLPYFNKGFIKTTDHRPTNYQPTDSPTTYHLPLAHRPTNHLTANLR